MGVFLHRFSTTELGSAGIGALCLWQYWIYIQISFLKRMYIYISGVNQISSLKDMSFYICV